MLNFVHITDCHLGDSPYTIYKNFNSYACLEKICAAISLLPDIDFVLVTGDISQTATKASYELFNSAISALQIPVYCLPGNHDDPLLLNQLFPSSPVDHVSQIQINGMFLFLLNTQVTNKEFGKITPVMIQELEFFFTQHPNMPAIVAMHHPLINTDTPWMDNIGIQQSEKLIEYFLLQKNIKLVLNGHTHMDIDYIKNNTQFYSTPSTCYQFKKHSAFVEYDTLMPGYRLIQVREKFKISSQLVRINI